MDITDIHDTCQHDVWHTLAKCTLGGHFPLPEGPGLGIDIVEERFVEFPYKASFHRGDKVNPDNSIAYI